ncbi:MAG: hypothetical protein HRU76_02500 [Phycisphaeraceae bacterium]|nr:hypothetical protein [Phycisphaerales bacterium]QOJ16529.1 MAG: hypothetical protein HRU76_02500 [Phycisphaeraceae bacterium]
MTRMFRFRSVVRSVIPVLSLVVVAAVAAALIAAAPRGANRGDDVSLHDRMEVLRNNLRSLARSVGDPAKQQESLKLVAEMQKHIVAAKEQPAPKLDTLPAAEREPYGLAYRKAMTEVLEELARLEIDIIDRNAEQATKRIRENLVKMRDAAHEKFNVDE